jgi:hypothetical protein
MQVWCNVSPCKVNRNSTYKDDDDNNNMSNNDNDNINNKKSSQLALW